MAWRLILLMLAMASIEMGAQDPVHRLIQTETGLASNEVYDVFQDSRGFIWIANGLGVSRYDGTNMRNYSIQEFTSEGASNLFEDEAGRIWFHSFWGQWFFIANDSLHHFHSFNRQLINPEYDALNQRIIFTTIDNICIINLKNLTYSEHSLIAITQGYLMTQDYITLPMMTLRGDILLISNEGNILLLDSTFHVSASAKAKTDRPYPFRFSGGLYLMQGYTLFQVNIQDKLSIIEVKVFPELKNARLSSVRQFGSQRLLICTYNMGAFFYDQHFKPAPDFEPGLFKKHSLSNALKDREGNYWFGTLKKGVLLVHDIQIKKNNIRQALLNCAFFYQSGKLLLGYDDGMISLYDLNKETETLLLQLSGTIKSFRMDNKRQIFAVSDHLYLIKISGSKSSAKAYYGTADCKDAAFSVENIPIVNNTSFCLAAPDRNSPEERQAFIQKWSATGRFDQFSRNGNHADIFILNKSRAFGLALNQQTDAIYTSATAGFYMLKPEGRKLIQYNNRNIFARAMTLVDGVLYCASDLGLMVIRDDSVINLISTKQGLRSDHLRKLIHHENHIYVVHDKGIDCIDLSDLSIASVLKSEIAPDAEITDLLYTEGYLYVAISNGLVRLPLQSFKKSFVKPLLHVGNMRSGLREYPAGEHHILPWNSPNIAFSFTGIHFRSLQEITYEYRLLGGGGNGSWIIQGAGNSEVIFNTLPPGNYVFEARARDIYGNYSETIRQTFRITPPFWKTYWFGLLAFGGLALLVFTINRNINRKRQMQANQLLEQERTARALQQSQLTALKAQMNPHFMFNALNSIQEFILTNEKKLANQYLGKFSDLMRMTLDMSQDEEVLLSDEIKAISLYLELEQLRFGKELEVLVDIAPQINPDTIYIPSMLIQPYIENALKHGLLHVKGHKMLQISFALKDREDVLICTVEDNGIGRARSEAIKSIRNRHHRSFATSATQKRLEILNSGRNEAISVAYTDKSDGRNEPSGTKVTIEVPFVR